MSSIETRFEPFCCPTLCPRLSAWLSVDTPTTRASLGHTVADFLRPRSTSVRSFSAVGQRNNNQTLVLNALQLCANANAHSKQSRLQTSSTHTCVSRSSTTLSKSLHVTSQWTSSTNILSPYLSLQTIRLSGRSLSTRILRLELACTASFRDSLVSPVLSGGDGLAY